LISFAFILEDFLTFVLVLRLIVFYALPMLLEGVDLLMFEVVFVDVGL